VRIGARPALHGVRIYLITDAHPRVSPIETFLRRAIAAGVGMVQLREKQLDDAPLLAVARRCAEVCRAAGAFFIVNDRTDIAQAAGADGVHLGQDDLPVGEVRRIAGDRFLIGLSTHSAEQIVAARNADIDYIGVGPVYETPTKPGRPCVGTELVRYAVEHAAQPFFAIGGIDPGTVDAVVAAGASRVSVLRYIAQADDPAAATREILTHL